MYPALSPPKSALFKNEGPPAATYATAEPQAPSGEALPYQQLLTTDAHVDNRLLQPPGNADNDPMVTTPPAAGTRPTTTPLPPVVSTATDGLVGLPPSRAGGLFQLPEDTFPKGPIGEVMKTRP